MIDSRTFRAVWCKDGKCPSDEYHFKGAAREVYSYMKLLGKNHGGFVFASIEDIARHTKNWRKPLNPAEPRIIGEKYERKQFCIRQVKRIIKNFKQLGILGDHEAREIHGRIYRGWQMADHFWWAEMNGGICDFNQSFKKDNVTQNVTVNVTQNVTADVT